MPQYTIIHCFDNRKNYFWLGDSIRFNASPVMFAALVVGFSPIPNPTTAEVRHAGINLYIKHSVLDSLPAYPKPDMTFQINYWLLLSWCDFRTLSKDKYLLSYQLDLPASESQWRPRSEPKWRQFVANFAQSSGRQLAVSTSSLDLRTQASCIHVGSGW